jgi:NADH dehydrogenase (ubiquinone) 1 alpha subcomplex subunit 10
MPGTSSLLRSGVSRFAATSLFNSATSPAIPQQQQIRTIRHDLRLPDDFPEPWPYKEKGFTRIDAIFDRTQARFNENSKLIVVEGNLGSGKSKVAKEIADTLGFHYIPDFRIEELVVDRYGIDLRDYYHLFPKSFRIPTYDMFYKNPADDNTARMSERCFVSRFDQYLNALAHILNTGQGVVMERSPFSDFVFTNAMRAKDYIGIEYFKHYFYMRKRTMPQIPFWPHAVVYIDTPVEKCLENIKQRGNSDQIATLDAKFLSVIRDSYKDSLREYRRHSKMLSYDWTKPGDTDTIVEDLERLDLDFFEWHSGDVLEEWYTTVDEVGWAGWRRYVTDKMNAHSRSFGGYRIHEVSELYINPRDEGHFVNVLINEVYKSRFTPGFNKHLGDDPMSGAKIWRMHQGLPEPWFDYWYHEHWLHQMMPHEVQFDSKSKESYDPDYLHHAH